MLSDDEFDHGNTCEPDTPASFIEQEEVAFIKRIMALPDKRPDPGAYRSMESDEIALDLLELAKLYSRTDPRPLSTPWRPYLTADDLSDGPCE
jgi:hypothetical protein